MTRCRLRFRDGVIDEFRRQPKHFLARATLKARVGHFCRRLQKAGGQNPRNRTLQIFSMTMFSGNVLACHDDGLLALFLRRETRRRTRWTLWLWSRREVELEIICLLAVPPLSHPETHRG